MSKSIIITDTSKLSDTIAQIGRAGVKLDKAIHAAAVSCLYHIQKDGQTTLYAKLAEAMPKGSRLKALHFWASHHAPMTVSTDKEGKVKVALKKGRTDEDFNLAGAEATPFWAFSVEKVPGPMTVEKVIAWLKKQTNPENERVEDDARKLAERLLVAATLEA